MADDLKKELQEEGEEQHVFEDQLKSDISSSSITSHKLSDNVEGQDCEEIEITQKLKEFIDLGRKHSDLGLLTQAKEYYDHAQAIQLKNLGPDHIDVAATYNNLGTVHRRLSEFVPSKQCHDRALAILLEKLGPEHADVATTYNHLGVIHRCLGDLEQSK